ncbi:hypothetical protein [Natronorarus salvus]|uniref:hypothetical protein n=1 Tax=Natronorarus salvus TaxID=3117733 RepID=UPI002F264CEE
MSKWKCDACGTVHRRNPKKCRSCGNTVLSPYHGGDEGDRDWLRVGLAVLAALVAVSILFVALVVL